MEFGFGPDQCSNRLNVEEDVASLSVGLEKTRCYSTLRMKYILYEMLQPCCDLPPPFFRSKYLLGVCKGKKWTYNREMTDRCTGRTCFCLLAQTCKRRSLLSFFHCSFFVTAKWGVYQWRGIVVPSEALPSAGSRKQMPHSFLCFLHYIEKKIVNGKNGLRLYRASLPWRDPESFTIFTDSIIHIRKLQHAVNML